MLILASGGDSSWTHTKQLYQVTIATGKSVGLRLWKTRKAVCTRTIADVEVRMATATHRNLNLLPVVWRLRRVGFGVGYELDLTLSIFNKFVWPLILFEF